MVCIIEQPGNVQIGLISMVIKVFYSCKGIDILPAELGLFRYSENRIQTFYEFFLSHFMNESLWGMRHIKGILPGISFLKSFPWGKRIKILEEFPGSQSGTDKI